MLTWIHSRKNGRLKCVPDSTYLFVTVINIDDPQYPKIAATGFSVMEPLLFCVDARIMGEGAREPLADPMSTL